MRYFITGGAGFIGSHLVDALIGRGDTVRVLDDMSTGRVENLSHLINSGSLEVVEGSVLDAGLVDKCLDGADRVVHLASAVGVQLVVSRPLDSLQRNIRGNDIVISAAAQRGVPLLFASTSEVYGKNSVGKLTEESDRLLGPPQKLRWAYATAKAYGEALCYAYAREQDSRMTVARLFNTVGPRQTGAYGMVLPRFVRQALAGEPLTVYGTGTQSRCFGHVFDVVQALQLLMDEPLATGRAFNIGQPVETTVIALARQVIKQTGSQSHVRLIPYEQAYDEGFEELGRRQPDTTAIEALTGWRAQRTVDDAIDDVIAYETEGALSWTDARLRLVG
jgi:UDP-glucose 4-epimerase